MTTTLSRLIKNQEQKIFKIKQQILFNRRAKCPRCSTRVILKQAGKSVKLCFYCTNCQLMFEK